MTRIALTLLLTLFLAPVQDEGTPVQDWLAKMDELIKAKDTRALPAQIDLFTRLHIDGKVTEKEYKDVVARLKKAYGTRRNAVQVKAVGALGLLGKSGAKELNKIIKDRKLKDDRKIEIYFAGIAALGATQDSSAVKPLLKLLNDKDNRVIATAAEALGNFQGAKGPVRKEIVKSMIRIYGSAFSATKIPSNTSGIEKFNVITGPMNNTLQALTRASPGNAEDWQRWFNDNKKRKW